MSNGILRIDYNSATEFCSLIHPYSKRFVDFVRYGIKPLSYRRWDGNSKRWEVHVAKLAVVILFAKSHFDHVDYRSLPQDLQIKIVAEMQGKQTAQETLRGHNRALLRPDPYLELHLQPTAPWEVVKAAYRALALLHHPDHGGNAEDFRRIQEAYEELDEKHSLGKEPGK